MKKIYEKIMPPESGLAVEVKKGQRLRITDLEGKQVVDMAVFSKANPREKLSTSYSRTRYVPKRGQPYIPRDKLVEGDTLMSSICRPMMTFTKDTNPVKGMHDVHNRMCNFYLYKYQYKVGMRDGCHEIISKAVAPYGIPPEDIPDTFDINMNYHHDCAKGQWVIEDPTSRPGDYVEFRAEMDCIVGLSNCPNEHCNAGRNKPVKVEVYK
jgi:uncharacterized protein